MLVAVSEIKQGSDLQSGASPHWLHAIIDGQKVAMSAEFAAVAGAGEQARALALQAIAIRPYDVRALRVLGFELISAGSMDEGARILQMAGALGWRDDATQLWVIDAALDVRDYRRAVDRIDAMLRRKRDSDDMLKLLFDILSERQTVVAVGQSLSRNPAWRSDMFRNSHSVQADQYAGFEALLEELRRIGSPGTIEELGAYVRHLINREQYNRAWSVWNRFSGTPYAEPRNDSATLPLGVHLDRPEVDPFAWEIAENNQAIFESDIETLSKGSTSMMLRIGPGSNGGLMRRLIVLRPGGYKLTLMVTADRPLSGMPVGVDVRCYKTSKLLTGRALIRREAPERQVITYEFVVDESCPAQSIDLVAEESSESSMLTIDRLTLQNI